MCPDSYSIFDENCYGLPFREGTDWADARAACMELTEIFNSFNLVFDLVSIHSSEENTFVYDLTSEENFFIGLKRNAGENQFEWSDQSPVSYENWGPDYPNRQVKRT